MNFHMFTKSIFSGKLLVTNFTHERHLSFVFGPIVPPQVPSMNVRCTTQLTFERLFTQVFLHVEFQQIVSSESNRTKMAFEGTYFTFLVYHLVLLEKMFLLETSAAKLTFELIIGHRVVPNVSPEVCFKRKSFLANGTLVRTYGCVTLLVIGKCLPFVERFATVGALETMFPERSPLMFYQYFLSFKASRAYFTLEFIFSFDILTL